MEFVSRWVEWLGPARFVFDALLAIAAAIALLLLFILVRRTRRGRYLAERDRRTLAIRKQWQAIVSGAVAPERWRFHRMDREIVESILADRLEVAEAAEAARLVEVLRSTGLLDMRIHEARTFRGWRRRKALVSLGRMRAPEAIPALADALDSRDAETRIAAVRGLGRTELPEAAEPLLERVLYGRLRVPERPLQNALLNCCRARPSLLLPYVRRAEDAARPLLARVLGEVATPELDEELLLLASDPLPEVRASAARALAEAKPRLALTALASLAGDKEWFVRLRAVVALGALGDPRAIPVLVETLCDSNRYVRLRSAAALAHFDEHMEDILRIVTLTRDRYAMQALVSELERSGGILKLMGELTNPANRAAAEAALLGALQAGTFRQMVDALSHHTDWRVRVRMARLLARSGETRLVAPLELREAVAKSPRERRILRWVVRQLQRPPGAPALEKVHAR